MTPHPPAAIDPGRMLDLIGIEGQLLTAATHDVHPDVPVPGASGRTVAEAIWFLGGQCEDALSWMGASEQAARAWAVPDPVSLRGVTARFTARLAELLAEFGTRPPQDACPTWWPEEHTVRFWIRRTLHATTVHRVDVQAAAGVRRTAIDADLALDGIDEALRLWLGYRLHAVGITSTRPCSVGVAVGDAAWLVHADLNRTFVHRAEPERARSADAVITGDPEPMYLWLWGRLPDREIGTAGDQDAVAQLWGLLRLATR
ncbi:maleylpyruvate isomerase N-terminal domain-containing protein [Saccharopolyspora sp. MS10]|uniref:maleylpyruvate isomerase N-terminal domain-containing protein n=1 Tax=Saccharopolyspora sp. MS10 TaxID=3385973 RepID=UPI00399F33CC